MGSTGGIGATGSWGATASATPSSEALSTVALDRDLPNADTATAAAALGAVARRTQDLQEIHTNGRGSCWVGVVGGDGRGCGCCSGGPWVVRVVVVVVEMVVVVVGFVVVVVVAVGVVVVVFRLIQNDFTHCGYSYSCGPGNLAWQEHDRKITRTTLLL